MVVCSHVSWDMFSAYAYTLHAAHLANKPFIHTVQQQSLTSNFPVDLPDKSSLSCLRVSSCLTFMSYVSTADCNNFAVAFVHWPYLSHASAATCNQAAVDYADCQSRRPDAYASLCGVSPQLLNIFASRVLLLERLQTVLHPL